MMLLPLARLAAGLLASALAAGAQALLTSARAAGLEKDSPYRRDGQVTTAEKTGVNATYLYDGNGLRVQKRASSSSGIEMTDYLWAGAEVLKEYTGMGAAKATYLLGAGREGIKTDQGWQFYLRDALGSTVMTTDASGEIAAQFEYGDWGETAQVYGSSSQYNPYRYTGQQFDGETGLYYLRARSYAPGLGRFTSRDPISYTGGGNLYGYCTGDPLNCSDPSGLEPDPRVVQGLEAFKHGMTAAGAMAGYYIGGAGGGISGGTIGSVAGPGGTVVGTAGGTSMGAAWGTGLGAAGGSLAGEIVKQTYITATSFAISSSSTGGAGGGGGGGGGEPVNPFSDTEAGNRIWNCPRLFDRWAKSLSRRQDPFTHDEARALLENAQRHGIKFDANANGLAGLETNGKWASVPHFKIGSAHFPVVPGFTWP